MSLRFRMDGAFFPTEVRDGSLIIYVGEDRVKIPFKFLTEDFDYDNTQIPISGIMCYLKSDNGVVIMRFDGTATKFNKDNVVIGFSNFDPSVIKESLIALGIGCARDDTASIRELMQCTVYHPQQGNSWVLEVIGDPEGIEFNPDFNKEYTAEVIKGTRYDPILIKHGPHSYSSSKGDYTIIGKPILTTGFHNI